MGDAAVGFLLENLKQLLLFNAELIGDAKDQIEGVYKDLILFKGFWRDSTEKVSNSNTLQALVDNITSVVYKAEDAIDKFVVHKAKYRTKSAIWKAMHAIDHSVTIRNIVKEIESIRKDVRQIYELKQFGFLELQLEKLPDRGATEKKPFSVEEDNVVGFDEEALTIISRLTREDLDLDIITITGMPGLGKTTLARKIYNDRTIQNEFSMRAWVFVSQIYSRREVFLSILSTFTRTTDYMDGSDEVLAQEIHKHLEKERYLIVMDDVWTKEAWSDIRNAFPNNNKGSRILITSRLSEVAHHANPTKYPHHLKFLSFDESRELLEKKVFGKDKCPSDELRMLGEQITAACNGLPLSVVMIAGILSNHTDSSDWWRHVAENVHSVFTGQEEFMDVVVLSYNHLPYHLKSCFLYFGVFPEDYEIPVWELIHLWIAEGFIEQNGEQSLEDTAEACLEDLVDRNLVMVGQSRCNGHIKTCRIHNLLRDFCKNEARKLNFYQEIERPDQVTLDHYRRVCIHSGVMEYLSSKPNGERVHSFLCFAGDGITLSRELISTIPKAFELLRVLDIRCIIFQIFPKAILQLALLRYIAMSCNIRSLPSSISRLWNTQTLIFMTTCSTLELKEDMWKMYQLRHLHTNASALLPHPPSSTLRGRENVQSLSTISPESCTGHVFARTPNIRKLGVRGNLEVLFVDLFDNVGKLKYLTNLKLFDDVVPSPPSEGRVLGLPPAYKFPTKLKKLTLSKTSLDWKQMHILGNLENLEELKLKDDAFRGVLWEPEDVGFLSLKLLHIGRTDLVTWKASEHHFPSLKRLVLRYCQRLEGVPLGLADVASFQELELVHASKAAAASARKIRQKKMTKEGQDSKATGGFKLSVYPPEI